MDLDWTKFHEWTKKYDPISHYAVDGIWKSSTKTVNKTARALDKSGWVDDNSTKDTKDFDRWLENSAGGVAAVFGGMYGAGALGGGGAGAATSGTGLTSGTAAGWSTGLGSTGLGSGTTATGGSGLSLTAAGGGTGAGLSTAGTTAGGEATGLASTGLGNSGAGYDWSKLIEQASKMQQQGKKNTTDPEKLAEQQRQEQLALALRRRNQTNNAPLAPGWLDMRRP